MFTEPRSLQKIDGNRRDALPSGGGANIEIGGVNSGQLVEYVRSFDPRSWSCLHVDEGGQQCTDTTIRYNDIGPCGHEGSFVRSGLVKIGADAYSDIIDRYRNGPMESVLHAGIAMSTATGSTLQRTAA